MADLQPGSRLRRAVVRGDLTALGVLLVPSGVALALLDGGAAASVAGVVAVVVGLGVVRWARAARRGLLLEVARAHRSEEPGPSPVPWLADALWRARNRFDPELDPGLLLLAEVDPAIRAYGRDATGAFPSVILRPVAPEERELAPVDPVPDGAPVPEPGDAVATKAALEATPGRFVALDPRWPICCGRPATLESDRPGERSPRALLLSSDPATPTGVEDPTAGGIHGFQCRSCGRRYATDPGF